VKTEPLPDSLATVTSPPIIRASLRVIASPSPVPPYRRAVEESAWVNSSNSLACCSAVMPMPVSATASSIQSRPLATLRARSVTGSVQNLSHFRLAERHPALAHAVMAPLICWSLSSSMLRYLFADHAVPAMWRSLAAARLSAD
jgi:hypothetical protein